jgi:hypothetical protein
MMKNGDSPPKLLLRLSEQSVHNDHDSIVVVSNDDNANGPSSIQPEPVQLPKLRLCTDSPSMVGRILNQDSVVMNDEVLLRFLLADRLHAEKAAHRIVEYYSLAMELFGDQVLTRPVMLGELNQHERRLLESGWIQLLLTRDTAGRRIMTMDEVGPADTSNIVHKVRRTFILTKQAIVHCFFSNTCQHSSASASQLKVFMYVFQVAAMDFETQKQGLHIILYRLFYAHSPAGTVNEDAWMVDAYERQLFKRFFACAPVRCSIIQINTPSPESWVRILPSVIQTMGKDSRSRIRFHEGKVDNMRPNVNWSRRLPMNLE